MFTSLFSNFPLFICIIIKLRVYNHVFRFARYAIRKLQSRYYKIKCSNDNDCMQLDLGEMGRVAAQRIITNLIVGILKYSNKS